MNDSNLIGRINTNQFFLLSLTLILALCSMIYELTLAQLMSATLGGTSIRYAFAIGAFAFSLGIGSIFFESCRRRWGVIKSLSIAELGLTLVGALSPFLILTLYQANVTFIHIVAIHSPLFIVGFLSASIIYNDYVEEFYDVVRWVLAIVE